MNKRTVIPYSPSSPPLAIQEVSRAAWTEFARIKQALQDLDRKLALSMISVKDVPVQDIEVWNRLFTNPVTIDHSVPADQMDTVTGIWTCPQEGLYSATIIIEIPAFSNPGQRIYEATLRTTVEHANGDPNTVYLSKTGGPDEASLRLVANFLSALNSGDRVWFDLDLTETGYTGTVTTTSILNLLRQGGYK